MLGNVCSASHRRQSLRSIPHSLPLALLLEESKSSSHCHPALTPKPALFPDVDLEEGRDIEGRRGALTDRPRFSEEKTKENGSESYVLKKREKEGTGLGPAQGKRGARTGDEKALLHLLGTYMELQVAQSLPRTNLATARCIDLPPPSKPYTLVIDLDETLVHREFPSPASETVLTVPHPNGSYLIGLAIRPYVTHCLTDLSKTWELIVFTASQRTYADTILDYIDPGKRLFAHRLYRDHCLYVNSRPVKDLRMLQHRDLRKTVIVDNSIVSFAYQLENGVPIRPWKGCLKDREMLKVARLLKKLSQVEDVREELKKTFDLEHFSSDYRKAQRKASGL